MKFLLDTDVCSYIIRKRSRDIIDKLKSIPLGEISISAITICEFESGIPGSENPERLRKAIQTFLSPFSIVEFQYADVLAFGRIDSYLSSHGTPIGDMDTLIAAQAVSRGFTLITNNVKHYSRVPELTFEAWK